jgi:predicted DNA-binding transcriptional regulator YafY
MKHMPRIVRLISLAAPLFLDEPVFFADFRRQFGVSMHTFHRDVRRLRRTGRYIDAIPYGGIGCSFT